MLTRQETSHAQRQRSQHRSVHRRGCECDILDIHPLRNAIGLSFTPSPQCTDHTPEQQTDPSTLHFYTSTQYKLSSSTIVYLHYLLFISLHTLRLELTAIHCTYFRHCQCHKDLCLMLLLPTASLHYRNQSHTKTMLCHSYRVYKYCLFIFHISYNSIYCCVLLIMCILNLYFSIRKCLDM